MLPITNPTPAFALTRASHVTLGVADIDAAQAFTHRTKLDAQTNVLFSGFESEARELTKRNMTAGRA